MLLSVMTAIPFSASALPTSGNLDENTAYSFEPALGELTIYGDSSIATRDFNTGSKPSPFKDNTEIKKVVIQGALGIGSCTFYGCTNLKEVTFSRKNTKIIGSSAFLGCTALETVNFAVEGTGITTIYEGAFSGCSSLKRISLPVTVNMIYSYAFKDCSSLQSVYIPNTNCVFASRVFENCTSLTSFSMPLNSMCVYNDMFRNCTSLTKLAIPYVPSYAFYGNALNGCTALTDIYFGGTQEQWSVYAEPGNNPLNSATVHYNCRYGRCGDDAEFVYDIAKKELTISGTGVTYGNKYNKAGGGPEGSDTLWYPYKDDIESVVIEEGITGIGHHNFADESNLKSITVPKSLEGVGKYAFKNCTALTDIYYAGTESEWSSLGNFTANGNSALDTATKHYSGCTHTASAAIRENVNPASCTENGSYDEVVYCSECGAEMSRTPKTTDALGHTPAAAVTENKVAATYDKAGSYDEVVYCSVCKTEISRTKKTIAKLPKTSLAKATVSGVADKVYTGSEIKPTVTVKLGSTTLKNGTDYKVTYTNNKNVGKATVTITGINKYSGTINKTFKINPKATKLTSVAAASKGFTAKWSKLTTQTTGYEIQYATDSKFTKNKKTVTITKNSTTSKKVTKLTAKKKYYVRIRTYKTVNGTKYYSAWSASKTVTTKK